MLGATHQYSLWYELLCDDVAMRLKPHTVPIDTVVAVVVVFAFAVNMFDDVTFRHEECTHDDRFWSDPYSKHTQPYKSTTHTHEHDTFIIECRRRSGCDAARMTGERLRRRVFVELCVRNVLMARDERVDTSDDSVEHIFHTRNRISAQLAKWGNMCNPSLNKWSHEYLPENIRYICSKFDASIDRVGLMHINDLILINVSVQRD